MPEPTEITDALEFLRLDHDRLRQLFDRLDTGEDAMAVATEVAGVSELHCRIEEEVFFPAVSRIEEMPSRIEGAKSEHDTIRDMLQDLRRVGDGDERRKALGRLKEHVLVHIEREERQMLDPAIDLGEHALVTLGKEMSERRVKLGGDLPAERGRSDE